MSGGITIKHIPNTLTVMRIIGSVLLLFAEPLSTAFYVLYVVCGISDILDGYLARRLNCRTPFGASLDSVADAVFAGAVLWVWLPLLQLPWWVLCWIGGIACIRIGSLLTGWLKFHIPGFIHTYANKATGLLLFCFPFLYSLFGLISTSILLCSAASLSAIEELAIILTSQQLSRDARSFNWRK